MLHNDPVSPSISPGKTVAEILPASFLQALQEIDPEMVAYFSKSNFETFPNKLRIIDLRDDEDARTRFLKKSRIALTNIGSLLPPAFMQRLKELDKKYCTQLSEIKHINASDQLKELIGDEKKQEEFLVGFRDSLPAANTFPKKFIQQLKKIDSHAYSLLKKCETGQFTETTREALKIPFVQECLLKSFSPEPKPNIDAIARYNLISLEINNAALEALKTIAVQRAVNAGFVTFNEVVKNTSAALIKIGQAPEAKVEPASFAKLGRRTGSPITVAGDAHDKLYRQLISIIGSDATTCASFLKDVSEKRYAKALRSACTSSTPKSLKVIEALLKARAELPFNIDEQVGAEKFSALHHAARKGNIEVYKILVASGADTMLKDAFERTASSYLKVSPADLLRI